MKVEHIRVNNVCIFMKLEIALHVVVIQRYYEDIGFFFIDLDFVSSFTFVFSCFFLSQINHCVSHCQCKSRELTNIVDVLYVPSQF